VAISGHQWPSAAISGHQVLAFEAHDGKLEVTEGAFESSTLDATVSGDITLNKRLARSRLRLREPSAAAADGGTPRRVRLAPDSAAPPPGISRNKRNRTTLLAGHIQERNPHRAQQKSVQKTA
jgi:hypothetical protein